MIKYDTETSEKPSAKNMVELGDIMKYVERSGVRVTSDFLKNHGFNVPEINWVSQHHPEIMLTNKRAGVSDADKDYYEQRIKRLESEVESKDALIKKFKSCFKPFVEIIDDDDSFIIKTVRTTYDFEKAVFKTKTQRKRVNASKVKDLYRVINFLTATKPYTTYHKIVQALILDKSLNVSVDDFNGGKNRSKYMFPHYYYPLQVLKGLGQVTVDKKNRFRVVRGD